MNAPDDQVPIELYADTPAARPDWANILARTKQGPLNNLDNVIRCIEHDPELEGRIWYDEFLDSICTDWQGPSRKWRDSDDVLLQLYIQRMVGLTKIGASTCHDAALVAAFRNTKNECREWMEGLKHDATPRLATMMTDGFGTPQNPYTEAVGRCWMVSMVARVMNPGCKVDTVPVLEGGQGVGKSSALGILGGKWFIECHESVLTKDFYGVLDGHMLVEIAEMHSFTRSEVERVKGIISCQIDRYRRAYGRNTEDHPRQSVLVCTTNRDDWQRDDTGARRFLPIQCGEINLDYLRRNRDQLFAEAIALYRAGAVWWDVPTEDQVKEVERRREVDAWEDHIGVFLVGRSETTIPSIAIDCLKIELSRIDQTAQKRIARILKTHGWQPVIVWTNGKTARKWAPITPSYT